MSATIVPLTKAVENAKAIIKLTGNVDDSIKLMPSSSVATRERVRSMALNMADAILAACDSHKSEPAETEDDKNELEMEFLGQIDADALASCGAMKDFYRIKMHAACLSVVKNVFKKITVKGRSASNPDWLRLSEGLIARRADLGLCELDREMDFF